MKNLKLEIINFLFLILLLFSLSLVPACGPKHRIVYEKRMPPPDKQEMKKESMKGEKPFSESED